MKPEDLQDNLLRDLLAGHPAPEANELVKQSHIANACAVFEKNMKKDAPSTQGLAWASRLTGTIHQTGRFIMTVISGKHRASVAFASIALAALGITTAMHLMEGTVGTATVETYDTQRQKIAEPDVAMSAAPAPLGYAVQAERQENRAIASDVMNATPPQMPSPKPSRMASAVPAEAAPGVVSQGMVSGAGIAESAQDFASAGRAIYPPYFESPPYDVSYPGNDRFEQVADNPVKSVAAEPVSTFSIDVDTASYSFVRRQISQGMMPSPDAVRIEEMINYFPYQYPVPESRNAPFQPTVALLPTPWNKDTQLLHVGIKGYEVARKEAPRSNLVFLIDTSGSMQGPDRLPLLVNCLKMLLETMDGDDTVAIVTYAGYSGVALEPTKVKDKAKILDILNRLHAGGSTAGAAGIETAYQLAGQHFDKEAVNRVILATDGDFNVGMNSPEALERLIENKRKSGVFLSVLGFGAGNYNDALMQKLAQNGNGTAAYIDTLNEGRKLLVEEATSALFPIAKDVKVQIEFNPAHVSEYRLIGYETRHLNREDFNNDKIDAGELGAGHTVTAIYEITPVGSKARMMDDLRYANAPKDVPAPVSGGDEIAFLKLRYKLPSGEKSRLMERPVTPADRLDNLAQASDDVRFAVAVASFGQKLKNNPAVQDYGYDAIVALADGARGKDSFGYRAEFVNLVRLAGSLGVASSPVPPQPVYPPQPVPMPAPGVAPSDPVYYQTR